MDMRQGQGGTVWGRRYLELVVTHVVALLTQQLAALHLHRGLVAPGLLHHLHVTHLEGHH